MLEILFEMLIIKSAMFALVGPLVGSYMLFEMAGSFKRLAAVQTFVGSFVRVRNEVALQLIFELKYDAANAAGNLLLVRLLASHAFEMLVHLFVAFSRVEHDVAGGASAAYKLLVIGSVPKHLHLSAERPLAILTFGFVPSLAFAYHHFVAL